MKKFNFLTDFETGREILYFPEDVIMVFPYEGRLGKEGYKIWVKGDYGKNTEPCFCVSNSMAEIVRQLKQ